MTQIPNECIAIIVAAIGFAGVIVGAITTFISQIFLEKRRENREYRDRFITNSRELIKLIPSFRMSLECLYEATGDHPEIFNPDNGPDNLYSEMVRSGKKISEKWIDFYYYLYAYFYEETKHENIKILEKIIFQAENLKSSQAYDDNGDLDYGKTYDFIFKKINDFKECRGDLHLALGFMKSIESKFDKLLRKSLKRKWWGLSCQK